MADAANRLPLDAGVAGPHSTEAFALLGDETRLDILLALWDAHEPGTSADTLSFADLFDRVDYDDTGNFSYHLDQLEGQFVRKTDAGYELRQSALSLIQSVIAGAGVQDTHVEQTEIDWDCGLCGATTAVRYEDGTVYHLCTECEGHTTDEDLPDGLLNGMRIDPAGVRGRCPEELLAAAGVAAHRHIRTMFEGLCSSCSGPIDAALDLCLDHESDGRCSNCDRHVAHWATFECPVCKDFHRTTPTFLAMFHPAIVAFYYDHGVSVWWHADDFGSIQRVVERSANHHSVTHAQTDPTRLEVTVAYEDDERMVTFDETASIIDVSD